MWDGARIWGGTSQTSTLWCGFWFALETQTSIAVFEPVEMLAVACRNRSSMDLAIKDEPWPLSGLYVALSLTHTSFPCFSPIISGQFTQGGLLYQCTFDNQQTCNLQQQAIGDDFSWLIGYGQLFRPRGPAADHSQANARGTHNST